MDGWSCNKSNDSHGKENNRITPESLQKGAGGQKFHCAMFL